MPYPRCISYCNITDSVDKFKCTSMLCIEHVCTDKYWPSLPRLRTKAVTAITYRYDTFAIAQYLTAFYAERFRNYRFNFVNCASITQLTLSAIRECNIVRTPLRAVRVPRVILYSVFEITFVVVRYRHAAGEKFRCLGSIKINRKIAFPRTVANERRSN